MAVTWGNWSNGQSGSKSRLGIERTSSSTASQTTVTIKVWVEFSGYYASSSGTLTLSGGHSTTRSVSLVFSASGTRNLGTFTQTFTRPWGAVASRSTQISLSGFAGGSPTIGEGYTIPRRLYSAPATPSSVTAAWASNTQADVSWTVPTSTSAPVTSVEVQRQSNNNSWSTNTSTFSSRSSSSRLSGLSRGNRYRWRVRGKNQDATGAWGTSGWVYQRPLDVANVVATRSGSDIRVSWVDRNTIPYGAVRIYDNGTYLATVAHGTTSWTHTAPNPAQTHRYSVRAYYGDLQAAHVYSNTVQLLSAPNPPTDLAPNGEPQPAGSTVRLSFTHNPGDNSGQTGYRLGWRRSTSGEYTWVENKATSNGFYDLPASAATVGTVFWTVATWGEHADLGGYAPEARFDVVTRPTVTVTAPSNVETDTATITITTPVTGPVAWEAEATINGEAVTSGGYGTSPFDWGLTDLPNGATVSVRARVMSRVWSQWTTATFTVAYAAPAPPLLEVTLADYAATITVTTPTVGTVEAVSARIQRQRLDGSWETLLDEADPEVSLTDTTVALNRATMYRAGSISATGVVAWSETVTVDPGELDKVTVFNFGDGYGQAAIIRYNPTLSENAGWAFEQAYVFAGQTVPTTIRGRARTLAQRFTGMIKPETMFTFADVDAWRALAGWEGLVLCRRPDAEPVTGVASDVTLSLEIWGGYQISLTHTESR